MNTDGQFFGLVVGLQSTAWIALGKMANPVSGKAEVNLEMAKDSIDTLVMLKEKTAGNLSDDEKNLLENALATLEINFVEEQKKQADPGKKEENIDKEEEKST